MSSNPHAPCYTQSVAIKRLKYLIDHINVKKVFDEASDYLGLENVEPFTYKVIESNEPIKPESQVSYFKRRDVLFGKLRPYLAKCWQAEFDGCCSSEFLVLREKELVAEYLKYFILSDETLSLIVSSTYGAKMPRASWEFIADLSVRVPSKETQHTIATFLDRKTAEIDALIADKQRMIELLQERRQALITEAVTKGLDRNAPMKDSGVEWIGEIPEGWEVLPLKRLVKSIKNGTTREQQGYETPYRVTRIETISQRTIDYSKVGYIDDVANLDDYVVERGDILFSHINSISMIGNAAIKNDDELLYGGMNLLLIKPNQENLPMWLYLLITSPLYSDYFSSVAKPAINQASISIGRLVATPCLLPPRDVQEGIVASLSSTIEGIKSAIQNIEISISSLQSYRQSLITEAVTGKINVTELQ